MRWPGFTAAGLGHRQSVNLGRHTLRSASLVGAVVLAAALAACDAGRHSTDRSAVSAPRMPAPVPTSRPRPAVTCAPPTSSWPAASRRLTIHSGDIGGSLYRIATPAGGGLAPAAVVSGDHVVTQLVSTGTNGPSIVDVTLSSAVAWTIHLDGGATAATVDMRDGGLAGLDFGAGVSRIDVTLPTESGTLPVRMSGGSSEFTVHAPAGVPARVSLAGGGGERDDRRRSAHRHRRRNRLHAGRVGRCDAAHRRRQHERRQRVRVGPLLKRHTLVTTMHRR